MNILFVSLGCDKNLVDSEVMIGLLKTEGHDIVDDEIIADVAIINSCCFIHDAKEESITTILEMAELKKTAQLKKIIVTGCLAERYKDEILKEIPEVDGILGSTSYDEIVNIVNDAVEGKKKSIYKDINYLPLGIKERSVTTSNFMAYLKIAEGCDKRCTYCIIPNLKGSYRSIPKEEILENVQKLAAEGIKELIVVAQETTVYGKDLYKEKYLPKLLKEIAQVDGIEWIRLLYCYPEEITDELIETMASEPKICHYIDMPIQHCENTILKRMGRRTSKEQIKQTVSKLRQRMPDIAIRTTLITGFPGETQEEHNNLLDFIDEMEFDRLGAFTYSREEDTAAYNFDNQISEEIKEIRRNEIMELQQEISYDKGIDMFGKEIKVIVEGYLYEDNVYVGRSYRDAPGVDGYVFIDSINELISGDIVNVKITDAKEYDLIGEVINEPA